MLEDPHKADKPEAIDEEGGGAAAKDECETPERKNGIWSQSTDNSSTIKKESSPAAEPNPVYKTPPKRTTRPSIEDLEFWDRVDRDRNRKLE